MLPISIVPTWRDNLHSPAAQIIPVFVWHPHGEHDLDSHREQDRLEMGKNKAILPGESVLARRLATSIAEGIFKESGDREEKVSNNKKNQQGPGPIDRHVSPNPKVKARFKF